MMVGQKQTLVRYDLSGAASAELNNGSFEGFIAAVDPVCGNITSGLLDGFAVHLLEKGQKPHAFVCSHASCAHGEDSNYADNFFHVLLFVLE
jgi:hypothetical protein